MKYKKRNRHEIEHQLTEVSISRHDNWAVDIGKCHKLMSSFSVYLKLLHVTYPYKCIDCNSHPPQPDIAGKIGHFCLTGELPILSRVPWNDHVSSATARWYMMQSSIQKLFHSQLSSEGSVARLRYGFIEVANIRGLNNIISIKVDTRKMNSPVSSARETKERKRWRRYTAASQLIRLVSLTDLDFSCIYIKRKCPIFKNESGMDSPRFVIFIHQTEWLARVIQELVLYYCMSHWNRCCFVEISICFSRKYDDNLLL